MPWALAPASGPPLRSYLTGASDLCVQDGLRSTDEQGAIRQDSDPRLHYPAPMDMDDQSQNGEEDDPPTETVDQQNVAPMASDGMLTIGALKERILLMLAAAGGGPVASGLEAVVPRAGNDHELISNVIAAVENAFAEYGEKALRSNCGNKLAKDESYGFLLADLVLGAIIPRDKAITLGEKLRKENIKIKKRRTASGTAAAARWRSCRRRSGRRLGQTGTPDATRTCRPCALPSCPSPSSHPPSPECASR